MDNKKLYVRPLTAEEKEFVQAYRNHEEISENKLKAYFADLEKRYPSYDELANEASVRSAHPSK